MPWGLRCSATRLSVLLPFGLGHGFPWDSLVFLLVLRGVWRECGGVGHGVQSVAFAQVIPVGAGPVRTLVTSGFGCLR